MEYYCPFCHIEEDKEQQIIYENTHCRFLMKPQKVLIGSGVITTRKHKHDVFELTNEEWIDVFDLLNKAKAYIDLHYQPQGYTIGWNVNSVAGQTIPHIHLHVIPRYEGEKHVGKGLRYWLKKEDD